jgi:hypothetical protein
MILEKHIAYRFLTELEIVHGLVQRQYPKEFDKLRLIDYTKSAFEQGIEGELLKAVLLYDLMIPRGQKAYYVTETVIDKLHLIKVKREPDWTVFSHLKRAKYTFIFPNNTFLRLFVDPPILAFAQVSITPDTDGKMARYRFFNVDVYDNQVSFDEGKNPEVYKECAVMAYLMLCFFFLAENEEITVQPKQRFGTKKSGKLINSLPFPITVVNNNWNVTSIRTEGFPVSGHFRLQPCGTGRQSHKLILIEPFTKNGYIRKAKKVA